MFDSRIFLQESAIISFLELENLFENQFKSSIDIFWCESPV